MDILKEFGSLFGVIGTIIVLLTFSKNFDSLSKIQKLGIVSLSLGILVPEAIDFVNGYMSAIPM